MRYHRPHLHCRALAVGLGTLVLWFGGLAPTVSAQSEDPVEQLRLALPSSFGIEEDPKALDHREKVLQQAAANLKTISDLRRALMLSDWKDSDTISLKLSAVDRKVRTSIGRRLEKILESTAKSADVTSRLAVATLIGEMGTGIRGLGPADLGGFARDLTPTLILLMHDRDGRVREQAARSLGNINPEPQQAAEALNELLKSKDAGDREAASEALGNIVRTIAQLQKKGRAQTGVEATSKDVIAAAAGVVPVGGRCVNDPDWIVRRNGLDAIVEAGSALNILVPEPEYDKIPPPDRPWSEFEKRRMALYLESVQAENRLFQPLVDVLKDQGNFLARGLTDPAVQVRIAARRSLEFIGSARLRLLRREGSIPTAEAPKGSADAPLSKALKQALEPGLLVIAKRATDPNIAVRRATLDFLETMEDAAAPAVPTLVVALSDPDRFIRWAASRTLGKVGPVNTELSVPALARLLNPEEDPDVRETVCITLRLYGTTAKKALPALIGAMEFGESEARETAIKALPSVGGSDVVQAIPALTKALYSKYPNVRRLAADTLGSIGPPAMTAVPSLRARLDDDDPNVRLAAGEALVQITRPKE